MQFISTSADAGPDVLSELLDVLGLHVSAAAHIPLPSGPLPQGDDALVLLYVQDGPATAIRNSGAELRMEPGSTALFVRAAQGLRMRRANRRQTARALSVQYRMSTRVDHPFLTNLPDVVMTPPDKTSSVDWLCQALAAELDGAPGPGADLAVRNLGLGLFVHLLRRFVQSAGDSYRTPMRDPAVYRALQLIHEDPSHKWTTDALARRVALSRATLYRRFHTAVGIPPGEYLFRWRMIRARALLKEGSTSVAEIAYAVGYEAPESFSRAFKQHAGMTPRGARY